MAAIVLPVEWQACMFLQTKRSDRGKKMANQSSMFKSTVTEKAQFQVEQSG
ncbi:hypothetical protein HRH25_04010 [Flavisolibacter sp. BT320]|nr:hypothetical protein [Flavisolibacter longurius]